MLQTNAVAEAHRPVPRDIAGTKRALVTRWEIGRRRVDEATTLSGRYTPLTFYPNFTSRQRKKKENE